MRHVTESAVSREKNLLLMFSLYGIITLILRARHFDSFDVRCIYLQSIPLVVDGNEKSRIWFFSEGTGCYTGSKMWSCL